MLECFISSGEGLEVVSYVQWWWGCALTLCSCRKLGSDFACLVRVQVAKGEQLMDRSRTRVSAPVAEGCGGVIRYEHSLNALDPCALRER